MTIHHFFPVSSHAEFYPLRNVKHKPRALQKRKHKTKQQLFFLCLPKKQICLVQKTKHNKQTNSVLNTAQIFCVTLPSGGRKFYSEHTFTNA